MLGQSESTHSPISARHPTNSRHTCFPVFSPLGDLTGIGRVLGNIHICQEETLSTIRGIRITGTLLFLPTLCGSYQRVSDTENILLSLWLGYWEILWDIDKVGEKSYEKKPSLVLVSQLWQGRYHFSFFVLLRPYKLGLFWTIWQIWVISALLLVWLQLTDWM